MWTPGVHLVTDVSGGEWLNWGITDEPSAGAYIPNDFQAVARVLHPAFDSLEQPVRWDSVASTTGARLTPAVQWYQLVGRVDRWQTTGGAWDHGNPRWGSLDPAGLDALMSVLAPHTRTPQSCWFALWDGWAHLVGGDAEVTIGPQHGLVNTGEGFSTAPRLTVRDRSYVLLHGPAPSAVELARYRGPDSAIHQAPNLVWPADRSWLVVTEIDMDSTLVAGTREAIADVVATPTIEALELRREDDVGPVA